MAIHFRRVLDDNDEPTERGTYRRVREYWDEYYAGKTGPNPYWAELCAQAAAMARWLATVTSCIRAASCRRRRCARTTTRTWLNTEAWRARSMR